MIDFDIVLTQIGGFGLAQKVLGIVIGYTAILSGFNTMSPVFINFTPDYRCKFPFIDNDTTLSLSNEELLNITTPKKEDGSYEFCKRYAYNYSCTSPDVSDCVDTSSKMACDDGYVFDDSIFPETVITEFQLVCDDVVLDSLATALYMVGVLIGSVVFGIVSDKFGRKIVLIGSSLTAFVALFGSAFTHNYVWFVIMRVLLAAFGYGIFLSSFVYLIEICENKYRSFLGIGYQAMFSVGYMTISGIAYNWRDWHELVVVSGLFCLPFALVMLFIPESPRWLFSVGRDDQAKEVSRKFAKYNGNKLDEPNIWTEASQKHEVEDDDSERKQSSILDLFRTGPIRIMTFKSMFCWFVNSAVYYGISFNADNLDGSLFVNNTINGAVEIASYAFLVLFLEKFGRRMMLAFTLGLAGVALLISTICATVGEGSEDAELASLVFAFVAKFGSAAAFAVIYNLTSELFPTVVRTNAVGCSSVVGRIGSIIAPLLLALQGKIAWLPNTILGALGIVGALMSFTFPETTGLDMMESIEEAERFYQGDRTPSKSKANFSNQAFKGDKEEKL